jgi:hypothetical protein
MGVVPGGVPGRPSNTDRLIVDTANVSHLPEKKRREVFLALYEAAQAPEGREAVAKKFRLTEDQLVLIEKAGMARCWPPLD